MKLGGSHAQYLFKKYLESRNYSEITVTKYLRIIRDFFYYLKDEIGKEDLREVTGADILIYQEKIASERKGEAPRYAPTSIKGIIFTLRHLFRYLYRNELILANPFDRLTIKINAVSKIRIAIDEEEMNEFLDSIEIKGKLNIRDRALFEMMYETGLRVSEVCNLDVTDIDLKSGKGFVREGKGRKDRVVPLGQNVLDYLKIYIKRARPLFLKNVGDPEETRALFLTQNGGRIGVHNISQRLQKRFKDLEIETHVTPHMIRHSFATHMLEHGADIKAVKDILGHSSMETTVIYTHFTVKSLKKLIKMYHPRENELYEEFKEENE
ncbi:MAG: tyrosine-type recombinase/integrase [Spirochaetales bacterium]|nr:tyrosine-type recombinase/integrase [Spirochaetales bacterium]